MSSDSGDCDTATSERLVAALQGRSADTLTDFIYRKHERILTGMEGESQQLNSKAATLIRLLGVLFTLYSGAVFIAARLTASDDTFDIALFINEYTTLSFVLLAFAFIYAILAYHRTEIVSSPSSELLRDEIDDSMTVTDAKREINNRVPGWVKNNAEEIKLDHTRLFNCKMCILLSLLYLVGGSVAAPFLTDMGFWGHVGVGVVVFPATFLVYDLIRNRATRGSS